MAYAEEFFATKKIWPAFYSERGLETFTCLDLH